MANEPARGHNVIPASGRHTLRRVHDRRRRQACPNQIAPTWASMRRNRSPGRPTLPPRTRSEGSEPVAGAGVRYRPGAAGRSVRLGGMVNDHQTITATAYWRPEQSRRSQRAQVLGPSGISKRSRMSASRSTMCGRSRGAMIAGSHGNRARGHSVSRWCRIQPSGVGSIS
jgi:hypothetical protein